MEQESQLINSMEQDLTVDVKKILEESEKKNSKGSIRSQTGKSTRKTNKLETAKGKQDNYKTGQIKKDTGKTFK